MTKTETIVLTFVITVFIIADIWLGVIAAKIGNKEFLHWAAAIVCTFLATSLGSILLSDWAHNDD